ncbi:uncharacterized protein Z520_04288 [Fonsecaea multimorphosa CBS 102226]|uniref:CBF1-interacting co-repressor CIR N-terminal domain-containing protein n=1 Tax=Fonsecaea multimorphosa CBS 102226 TaxID=1442371 RepID=A0A0D2KSF8_9EURO|nr:uncharacterized protein Z520_04288 [Fonsecaea multimorphosa CBS 102226]KIX99653.1 hypothetical protein Z520_04288 [Fonsecaea multimorphosa CBS 102226]OAL26705.1 hypothetical protein AYO22_04058 [Fonsecaea multimorphosa]
MPLHLLPKKSWNVYSPANIERVKRDEAKARDQAAKQEEDSLRREADDRISILQQQRKGQTKGSKRKLPGEDDTDRDIRLALETPPASTKKEKQDHSSLVDANGHISLIPVSEKPPCVGQEQAKDPYTVYLSDAVGERDRPKNTWYMSVQDEREKWGDEDPRKRERELTRLNANDPLAAMKRGVKALRENERQRQEWMRERERDLAEVEGMGRRENYGRKRRKRADYDEDESESLEGFNLDEGYTRPDNTATGTIITTIIIVIDDDTEIKKLSMGTATLVKGMKVEGEMTQADSTARKLNPPDEVKTIYCRIVT